MNLTAKRKLRTLLLGVLTAANLIVIPARADVIMDWNAKADAIGVDKQILNAAHSRGLAMVHIAMFEAVNAIDGRYTPYKLNLTADPATSKEAAAAVAAYEVLVTLYPDQKPALDATLAASLSDIADTEAKTKGIDLERRAASGIIALRSNDGTNVPESYRPHAANGVYVPTTVPISPLAAASLRG